MPLIEAQEIKEWRAGMRLCPHSFLLRAYEAEPTDYEAIGDEDFKCEYHDGVLIVHSPASYEHERLAAFLVLFLGDHVTRHKLGTVLGSNAVMQLGERRFSPDVSFLSAASEKRVRGGRVHGPMDLVVEVLSSSTRAYDRGEKLTAYQQGNVPEIWLIDPDERRFDAYVLRHELNPQGASSFQRPGNNGGSIEPLEYEHTLLTAGRWNCAVLPKLVLDVDWLWRRPLPSLDECHTQAQ